MKRGDLFQVIEPIVRGVGALIKKRYLGIHDFHYKSDGSFATEVDLEAEAFLLEHLKNIVPGAGFFAEESGVQAGNDFSWVIDPLDGTTNFAYGLPYFCTSIALTKKSIPIMGAIYQPLLDEFFYAEKGCGASLNGQTLKLSNTSCLVKSLVAYEYPYFEDTSFYSVIEAVNQKVRSTRRCGAAALDLAYCAAGRVDAVFLGALSWWDIAAGLLLITEAGGEVSTFSGDLVGPGYKTFIGGNKLIVSELMPILRLMPH